MENKSGSMNEKMFSQEHDTERTINKKDNKAKNEVLTYIRDYRVMTNLKYRLITNILIPLLAIFIINANFLFKNSLGMDRSYSNCL